MSDTNQHSTQEREDELREEFWAVAGDDLGSVATSNVARALTGLVRLLASTEEQLEAAREEVEQLRERLEGSVRETKAYCSRCLSYVPLGWSHTCNGEVARTWEKADPTNYIERTLT